jgi:hypothetical protein
MEDDIDWDVRLKSQMAIFSLASRAYLRPLRASPSRSLMNPNQESADGKPNVFNVFEADKSYPPWNYPYGGNWDMLWLGHIGTEMPSDWKDLDTNTKYPPRSLTTITIPDDDTVPVPEHLKSHPFADRPDHMSAVFPPHTRLVHESRNTMGAQAYAVTQQGARRLLHQFGLNTFTSGYDVLLRDWCDGVYHADGKQKSRPVCLTVNPPLFSHYYAKSGGSDIHGIGGGFMKKVGSPYVRLSVKANMGRMLDRGSTEDMDVGLLDGLVDQWPDDAAGPW